MKSGTCRHFNGVQNDECRAGVKYKGFSGGLPCITRYRNDGCGECTKYEEPTVEEIAATRRAIEGAVARMKLTIPLISKVKKERKGQDWQGVEECPICKGRLHLSHARYNGHVHARCETRDCLAWME